MALSAAARSSVFVFLSAAILVKNSVEKCTKTPRNHFEVECDSLQDLSFISADLAKDIRIRLQKSGSLEQFKPVTSDTAKNIERLEIYESINNITADAFKNFTKLDRLTLFNNDLSEIPPGTFQELNVKYLHLSENRINRIAPGAFRNLKKVETLRVTGNNIKKITVGIFQNLQTLTTLSLSKNHIDEIEKFAFVNIRNLTRLYLDGNNLKYFAGQDVLNSNSHMERLWLHNNSLTEVTGYMLEGLSSLEVLNLGYNSISSIEPNAFAETPRLVLLVLTHNQLKVLDGNILPAAGLSKLKILYMDHNKLMFLSSRFLFRLHALTRITIAGNPWQCACLNFLLKWLVENNVLIKCDLDYFSGKRPICVVPSDAKSDTCTYSYDETLVQDFDYHNNMYPPSPKCLL